VAKKKQQSNAATLPFPLNQPYVVDIANMVSDAMDAAGISPEDQFTGLLAWCAIYVHKMRPGMPIDVEFRQMLARHLVANALVVPIAGAPDIERLRNMVVVSEKEAKTVGETG